MSSVCATQPLPRLGRASILSLLLGQSYPVSSVVLSPPQSRFGGDQISKRAQVMPSCCILKKNLIS
jgi:hypothetical protein